MENLILVADKAHEKMSAKYKTVQTNVLAQKFKSLGFVVDSVEYKRVRKGQASFAKHMVKLSHPSLLRTNVHNDGRLQLIITNSFDGTAAFKMQLGFFRLVCSNGLIVGDLFENIRHKHIGGILEKIDDSIERIVASTKKLEETITKMKEKKLSVAELVSFEREAMKLRGDKIETVDWSVRRVEDSANDVFTVLNRIQEDLIRGGVRASNANNTRVLREIRSIERVRELNEKLFDLGMKYANAA